MITIRPNDENGDYMPVYESDQLLENNYAIAQIVKERLFFYKGEWWENELLGIAFPEYLMSSMRSTDIDMLGKYITSYVANTEGVTNVSSVRIEYDKHKMIYKCVIMTEYGNAPVEVNLSGIL